MEYFDALRARALYAVLEPDEAAIQRSICRWYSREFHTPLHVVEALPLEDILVAYLETKYENMEPPEIHDEIAQLTLTPEERASEEASEDAFYQAAVEDARKERERRAAEKQAVRKPHLEQPVKQPVSGNLPDPTSVRNVPHFSDNLPTPSPDVSPEPPDELPEIEMTFDSNLDQERVDHMKSLLQRDPARAPPPGKKKP